VPVAVKLPPGLFHGAEEVSQIILLSRSGRGCHSVRLVLDHVLECLAADVSRAGRAEVQITGAVLVFLKYILRRCSVRSSWRASASSDPADGRQS